MKIKVLLLSVILLIFSIVQIHSFSQEVKWKGTIEEEDGIKVIKNPNEPFYGEIEFELEEDLSISDRKSKKFKFHEIGLITLDNQENIYALDTRKNCILKFDSLGNYLQEIGRKGQGPGEFERPSNLFVDNQHYLYASDQRKIQIFNSTGKYVKSIRLDYEIYEFFIDSTTNIIAITHVVTEDGTEKAIIKFDNNGRTIKELSKFPDVRTVTSKNKEGKKINLTVYHEYNYWPYLYPISSQKFIFAYPNEFKLYKMNSNGDLELIVEKKEPPQSITRKEKGVIIQRTEARISRRGRKFPRELIEAACQFPPHRPFFNRILVDDKKRIYARRVDSILDKNEEKRFDIFGEDGCYLYRAKLPFTPEIIRHGFIYDINFSEESNEFSIKKYKIKNWDQIKTRIN